MKISIFGLGYVGIVSMACFAKMGHDIIGVDINPDKIKSISNGKSPIIEGGLDKLLIEGRDSGKIEVTTSAEKAVQNTELSIICVGTPSKPSGELDLSYVYRVCSDIGNILREKNEAHQILIRSTVLPGTTLECKKIVDKNSDKNIAVGFNPEFLREGSAVKDFYDPPYTIVGPKSEQIIDTTEMLYGDLESPIYNVELGVAELIKYASNAWHATKITFANEMGRIAKEAGVDGVEAMNILVQDTKLNTSSAYMRPGFAYGGSCLPKDVRALEYYGKVNNVKLPLLDSLAQSNKEQIDMAIRTILNKGWKDIILFGLAFKSGTDDLRESPAVELAEGLLGKGVKIKIFDPAVDESRLIGSNKAFINQKLPHLSELLVSNIESSLSETEAIVVTHNSNRFYKMLEMVDNQLPIYDLSGMFREFADKKQYEGLVW